MTPSRRRPDPPEGEAGVATVLGAILLFGLLVVTLITIQVEFVPVWEHQRESDHMRAVHGQMAQVKSDADRLADNRTIVPVTDPVTLATGKGFIFFTSAAPPGSLAFEPSPSGSDGISITSPQIHLLSRGGRPLFAGSESWTQLVSGGSVNSIAEVLNLRIRIAHSSLTSCSGSGGQGLMGTVSLGVTDAGGAYAGRFDVAVYREQGQNCSFRYSTYAKGSSTTPVTIYTETFYWHPSSGPSPGYEYIDTLRSEFSFGDVLAQATTPMTLSQTVTPGDVTPTPVADYTLGYKLQTQGGTVQVGGGGIVIPNFAQGFAGGELTMHSPNQRFPEQTYILEHGALIVQQPDGKAMVVPPEFDVRLVGGQVDVAWTIPALVGASTAVTGPAQASVMLAPVGGTVNMEATMARLSATLATQHPEVWADFLTTSFQGAGLSDAGPQPQFRVTAGPSSVTLDLYGLVADPASTVDDLSLTLKGANIAVTPLASAGG